MNVKVMLQSQAGNQNVGNVIACSPCLCVSATAHVMTSATGTHQPKYVQKRAYNTPDSHVVPHRSTDRACIRLTAQFG
jgi:hypothetical protein